MKSQLNSLTKPNRLKMENREIKFRAWDGKEIIYPSIIGLPPYENFAWPHSRSYIHNCEDWDFTEGLIHNPVLMQYARKDNFDNELFELDIIERTIKSFDNSEPPVKTIEIVCFRDAGFVSIEVSKYKDNNPPDWTCLQDYYLHSIRKIGNTFDNANLLK